MSHEINSRSILQLDKSEAPFECQLDTANTLLEIKRRSYGPARLLVTSDTRPGHALRWLLKKLQFPEEDAPTPRNSSTSSRKRAAQSTPIPQLSIKAWELLRELLTRTPIAKTARLLKEHEFTRSLRLTLEWLYEHSYRRQVTDDEKLGLRSKEKEQAAEEWSASRKCKRADSGFFDDDTRTSPNTSAEAEVFQIDQLRWLHLRIRNVVTCLQELVRELEQKDAYLVEHLKFSLRNTQEEAASILGRSLYITNQIIQRTPRNSPISSDVWHELIDATNRNYVDVLVELWESRSRTSQDLSDEISHVCDTGGKAVFMLKIAI